MKQSIRKILLVVTLASLAIGITQGLSSNVARADHLPTATKVVIFRLLLRLETAVKRVDLSGDLGEPEVREINRREMLLGAVHRAKDLLLDDIHDNDRAGLQQIDIITQLLKVFEQQGVSNEPNPDDMDDPGQTMIEFAEAIKSRIEDILESFDV